MSDFSSSYEITTSDDQEKSRDAVIEDAGPVISELSADEFINALLPPLPCSNETLQRILRWMKDESGEYSKGRWTAFKQDPQSYKIKEDQVFSRLDNIVSAIQRAVEACAPGILELKTRYISIPSKAPDCSHRYNLTRPDGCFVFKRPRSVDKAIPDWMDIALTGEFKKDENITKKINDDIKKALWNLHHSMREDAVRTRAWGFTIENRTLRMWYAGRADIFVSHPEDFMTTPDLIIRLFLSFMYASEESMGWDPTMICDWDGDSNVEPQYKIKVQSADSPSLVKWYRTVKLVSAVGAEAIRGRGTRVWRVREILEDGTLSKAVSILKDVWADSDRMFEADMIQEINKDAETLAPSDKDALVPCLLTPAIAGPVMRGDGTIDATVDGRRRDRWYKPEQPRFRLTQVSTTPSPTPSVKVSKVASQKRKSVKSTKSSRGRRSSTRAGSKRVVGDPRDAAAQEQSGSIVYGRKIHYRIVFKEDCEVLHEITSLERVVYALTKACAALQSLHMLGWVHRDISSGNILLIKNQVKIADFEYAKKLDLPGKVCHDIRTGTEDFMAVEVRLRAFGFTHDETRDATQRLPNVKNMVAQMNSQAPVAVHTTPSHPSRKYTWFYNPLHDLESVWWIFSSVILNKDIVPKRAGNPSIVGLRPFSFDDETEEIRRLRILHHWAITRTLFSGRSGRYSFAYSKGVLSDFLDEHPLHPAIRPLAAQLEAMRASLAAQYRIIERNPLKIDHTSAGKVHDDFMEFLLNAWNHIRSTQCDIQLRSLGPQVKAIPSNVRDAVFAQGSHITKAGSSGSSCGSKRSRVSAVNDDDAKRCSKSARTSQAQQSPIASIAAKTVAPPALYTKCTVRQRLAKPSGTKADKAPPPVTRLLRSQTRKAAVSDVVLPPLAAPPRASRPSTQPRGKPKATKNNQATKAAAKIAEKVKSKTRKGR